MYFVVYFMDAGQAVAMVPSLVAPNDVYWLIAGGVVGALARALWTHDQKSLGWETGQDVVIGAIIGGLYNLSFTLPGVGLNWPIVPLPVHATALQRAMLVAVISMVGVAAIKRVLFAVVPAYMGKLIGQLPGGQPNGNFGGIPPPIGGANAPTTGSTPSAPSPR